MIPTASNEASSKHPLQLTRLRDKWRPILTAVLACAFVWLVLLTFCADEDEPRFEGKRLTVWLDEYQRDCGELFQSHGPHVRFSDEGEYKSEARSAIRKIGTNAVPVLMRLLRAKDSPLTARLVNILRKQSLIPMPFRPAADCQEMACYGFHALGEMGRDAVPALTKMLDPSAPLSCLSVADCLGNIGPEAEAAIPVLVQFLESTNRIVRWDATANLGRIHRMPELVVPILITNLTASNAILPTMIDTLAEYGAEARRAVPQILEFLGHENARWEAANALKKIAPELAAEMKLE